MIESLIPRSALMDDPFDQPPCPAHVERGFCPACGAYTPSVMDPEIVEAMADNARHHRAELTAFVRRMEGR